MDPVLSFVWLWWSDVVSSDWEAAAHVYWFSYFRLQSQSRHSGESPRPSESRLPFFSAQTFVLSNSYSPPDPKWSQWKRQGPFNRWKHGRSEGGAGEDGLIAPSFPGMEFCWCLEWGETPALSVDFLEVVVLRMFPSDRITCCIYRLPCSIAALTLTLTGFEAIKTVFKKSKQ